jgi:hypothetical protein
MWTLHYPTRIMHPGETLRVFAADPFRLRCSRDNWTTSGDCESTPTGLNIYYVDVQTPHDQRAPIRFTFYWLTHRKWHGSDYAVAVESVSGAASQP